MDISEDVTMTLRASMNSHPPVVLVYDARGNGGGVICPTITGDHQNRVTDYTALVIQNEESHEEDTGVPCHRLCERGDD